MTATATTTILIMSHRQFDTSDDTHDLIELFVIVFLLLTCF